MVPLASWFWLLALERRHQHAAGETPLILENLTDSPDRSLSNI